MPPIREPMHFEDDELPQVHAFANGVRLILWPQAGGRTAAVSVYLHTGSVHERRDECGISHMVEHMVFKGTRRRDVQRINLDAEALGAELNAHTDKDHTAFHLQGLGEHAPRFVHMLADLVCEPVFPAQELERERDVLLQELAEDDDDAVSTGYKLLDRLCWGDHPVGRPVIGRREGVQRLGRDALVRYVAERYVAPHVVVTAAGPVDAEAVHRAVGEAFGGLAATPPRGKAPAARPAGARAQASSATVVERPAYAGGGIRSRHLAGSVQANLLIGLPCAGRGTDDHWAELAAAVLGEGMSSPLLDELREKRGLAYHATCAADVLPWCGQFVIEASVAPAALDEALALCARLLRRQARGVEEADLARARHQLAVRWLRQLDRPARRMEEAALDLMTLGRVRSYAERWHSVQSVTAKGLARHFEQLLARGAAVAVTGGVGRSLERRVRLATRGLVRS